MQAQQVKRRRRRKWFLWLPVLVVVIGSGTLAWVTADERLGSLLETFLSERLQTPVTIEGARLRWLTGLDLDDVVIAALEPFETPIFSAKKVRVRWSLGEWLRRRFELRALRFDEAELVIERDAEGETNIGRWMATLLSEDASSELQIEPPPDSTSAEDSPVDAPSDLGLPEIPGTVRIRDVGFRIERVVYRDLGGEGVEATLGPLWAELDADIVEADWRGDVRVGLGDGPEAPGRVQAQHGEMFVDAKPWSGLEVQLRESQRLTWRWEGATELHVVTPTDTLPTLPIAWHVAGRNDIALTHLDIDEARVEIATDTVLEIQGSAKGLPEVETLKLTACHLRSRLESLTPIWRVARLPVDLRGHLSVEVQPGTYEPMLWQRFRDWPNLHLETQSLSARHGPWRVSDVDWSLDVEAGRTQPQLAWKGQMGWLRGPGVDARRLRSQARAQLSDASLAGLMQDGVWAGRQQGGLRLEAARLHVGDWYARDARFRVRAQRAAPAKPLQAHLDLEVTALRGRQGERTIELPPTTLDGDMVYGSEGLAWEAVSLKLGESLITSRGAVAWPASDVLMFERAELRAASCSIAAWRRYLGLKDLALERGTLGGVVRVHGVLNTRMEPPTVSVASTLAFERSWDGLWDWQAEALPPFHVALQLDDGQWVEAGSATDTVSAKTVVDAQQVALELHRQPTQLDLQLAVKGGTLLGAVAAKAMDTQLQLFVTREGWRVQMDGAADSLEHPELLRPLRANTWTATLSHRLGEDLRIERLRVETGDRMAYASLEGFVAEPLTVALEERWKEARLPGVEARLETRMQLEHGASTTWWKGGPGLGGRSRLQGDIRLEAGTLQATGVYVAEAVSYDDGHLRLNAADGEIPFDIQLRFADDGGVLLTRELGFGGGVLSWVTATVAEGHPTDGVLYDRLKPYRGSSGFQIRSLHVDLHRFEDVYFDAYFAAGELRAHRLAMGVLGGDVVGDFRVRLGRDAAVHGEMNWQLSKIDASRFQALNLDPGPDSELHGDMHADFVLAAARRNLNLNMNISKIGPKTLDRFLLLLDPERQDEELQSYREHLDWVRIRRLSVWVRHERLNMDLDSEPILRIPGTGIGLLSIPRDLLRRYSISPMLDAALEPYQQTLGGLLGWSP